MTIAAAAAIVLCLTSLTASRQAPPAARPPMAEEVFKNIQVLKGIPVDQFLGTMGIIAAATARGCTECHRQDGAADWGRYALETPMKQVTRQMLRMTSEINRTHFGGRQVITCYSCHRGGHRPKVTPSLSALYSVPPDEPYDIVEPAPGAPPADQIFAAYLAAIGGAARVAALTSYTGRGTYEAFDDDTVPLEVYAQAPNQRVWVWHTSFGDYARGYNGREGWIAASRSERPLPVEFLTGQELDGTRLEAELLFPTRIARALTAVRVGFPVAINDRDVQVVQGTTAGGTLMTLYFDNETGLLTRLTRYTDSPIGRIPTQYDYDDYRPVAGVRMPFKWTRTWLNGRSVFQLTNVQPNVTIPPARFARPAP
jgi:photosynthetic reaction center cytochrome c subunit